MRAFAGPGAAVEFTHMSPAAAASLSAGFAAAADPRLAAARCHAGGVLELLAARGVPHEAVCLLDPRASAELAPEDGARFSWFLFGVRRRARAPPSMQLR
jgi:ribosome biogenesis SPOUT family RNA methylase Rps3